MSDNHPETGRELKVSELKPGEIVVVAPPGHEGLRITVWVSEIDDLCVAFYAGEADVTVIIFIQPDGTLQDDKGRLVRVFEYLGEP